MTTGISRKAERTIIQRLKKAEDPDQIILDLCNQLDLNWQEGEALVQGIQAGHQTEITLSQSPILAAIALLTFLVGVGLAGFAIYDLTVTYNEYNAASAQHNGPHVGYLFLLFAGSGFYWETILIGLLMIIGSLRGMQDVWAAIFAKLGMFQGGT